MWIDLSDEKQLSNNMSTEKVDIEGEMDLPVLNTETQNNTYIIHKVISDTALPDYIDDKEKTTIKVREPYKEGC